MIIILSKTFWKLFFDEIIIKLKFGIDLANFHQNLQSFRK